MYQKIAFLQMNFICELAEVKVKPHRLHMVPGAVTHPTTNPAEQGLVTSLIVRTEVTYGTLIMLPPPPRDHGLVSKNSIS